MTKSGLVLCLFLILMVQGCKKDTDYIIYHKFPDQFWYRYNILQFEIPIEGSPLPYDISFFANHTKDYSFDNLDFNMIMTTPSGEERINEYHFVIKRKDGGFTGTCYKDSCQAIIALKKGILLRQKGTLKIAIENLVPRLEIKGLLGVGIRMHLCK